ncbi:MAG: transketolase [Paludibacteraceae bacterium]|nr:transketolase [Paludibacteraceae bacterium]
MNKTLLDKLTQRCYAMKLKALDMAFSTGTEGSHIGGAFSCMEILAALYETANVEDMSSPGRDRIILSKGHAVLAYYTALWQKGFLTEEQLAGFDQNGTGLYGHPHRNLQSGMEFTAGSLGLGLSYAVGVAMACKKRDIKNRIFVILGDGECDEGIVWESLMSIRNFELDNMTLIVDRNHYQLDGPTTEVMNLYSMDSKFRAFGFNVTTVNGHGIEALYDALQPKEGLNVIIADTVKAHGISFLANNKLAHHTSLTMKKYQQAVNDIKAAYGEL